MSDLSDTHYAFCKDISTFFIDNILYCLRNARILISAAARIEPALDRFRVQVLRDFFLGKDATDFRANQRDDMALRIFTWIGIDPVGDEGRVKIGMETVEQGVGIGTDGADGVKYGIAEQAGHQRRECFEQVPGEFGLFYVFFHDQDIDAAEGICVRSVLDLPEGWDVFQVWNKYPQVFA